MNFIIKQGGIKFPLIFLFVFLVVTLEIVVAVPPVTTTQQFTDGYIIKYPTKEFIKQNSAYEFEAHVFNISTGKPITANIGCYFHLYNSSGNHVAQLYNETSYNFDYSFPVNSRNFTALGDYYFIVQCNSTNYGGFVEIPFTVTSDGQDPKVTLAIAISLFLFSVILLLIAFVYKNLFFAFFSGVGFTITGIYGLIFGFYTFNILYPRMVSAIVVGMGMLLMVTSALDMMDENYGKDSESVVEDD